MMDRGIFVEGLTKSYVRRKRQGFLKSAIETKVALNDFSFKVPPGQIIGLLGLNGAGKTTTIKILSTLLLPTRGQVRIDDLDLIRDASKVRKKINMIVGGEKMLYWQLTGRENLWYFAKLYNVEQKRLKSYINDLLHMVGLDDAADTPVERYSKGMKQRLQIARGLINDPTYLFLDEPTLGLDVPIARDVRHMVQQLTQEGKGVLLTSHYLAEVEELCSHIYVIDQGQLIATGTSEELKKLTHVGHTIRIWLNIMLPEIETALNGLNSQIGIYWERKQDDNYTVITVKHSENVTGHIFSALSSYSTAVVKLDVVEPTLEDAVVVLTMQHTQIKEATQHVTK